MIRTRALLIVAIVMLAAVPVAHAAGYWTVGINGGIAKPTGDYGKDLKVGPAAGVDICLHLNDRIAVGAEGNWTQSTHKDVGVVEDLGGGDTYTLDKDKLKDISGGIHGQYMFPVGASKVTPYGLVGLGFYSLKEDYQETLVLGGVTYVDTDETDGVKGDTRIGGKFGAGATYMANEKVGIDFRAEYNIVTVDTSGAPSGTPSTFKFFGVRAGVNFRLQKQP
jgi:opacity protein-like surface antigen